MGWDAAPSRDVPSRVAAVVPYTAPAQDSLAPADSPAGVGNGAGDRKDFR